MKNIESKKCKKSIIFVFVHNLQTMELKFVKNHFVLLAGLYLAEQSEKLILSYHFHGFLHIWDHCDFFPFTRENIYGRGRAAQFRFTMKKYTLCKNP